MIIPIGVYLLLVLFSDLSWSWFWFFLVLVLSGISSAIFDRKFKKAKTESYFLGVRYVKNRYNLSDLWGWDEREDTESEAERGIFNYFSKEMKREQFRRLFPDDFEEQQLKVEKIKKINP